MKHRELHPMIRSRYLVTGISLFIIFSISLGMTFVSVAQAPDTAWITQMEKIIADNDRQIQQLNLLLDKLQKDYEIAQINTQQALQQALQNDADGATLKRYLHADREKKKSSEKILQIKDELTNNIRRNLEFKQIFSDGIAAIQELKEEQELRSKELDAKINAFIEREKIKEEKRNYADRQKIATLQSQVSSQMNRIIAASDKIAKVNKEDRESDVINLDQVIPRKPLQKEGDKISSDELIPPQESSSTSLTAIGVSETGSTQQTSEEQDGIKSRKFFGVGIFNNIFRMLFPKRKSDTPESNTAGITASPKEIKNVTIDKHPTPSESDRISSEPDPTPVHVSLKPNDAHGIDESDIDSSHSVPASVPVSTDVSTPPESLSNINLNLQHRKADESLHIESGKLTQSESEGVSPAKFISQPEPKTVPVETALVKPTTLSEIFNITPKAIEMPKEKALKTPAPGSSTAIEGLLIDDFESRSGINKLGNRTNTFERSPSLILYYYPMDVVEDQETDVLKLTYDKQNSGGPNNRGGWCGYYTMLKNETTGEYLDGTKYQYLTFWTRGESGTENFVIGLADKRWESLDDSFKSGKITSYTDDTSLGTKWKKIKIPLSVFSVNFSNLAVLAISFESVCFIEGGGRGSVFIDHLKFE